MIYTYTTPTAIPRTGTCVTTRPGERHGVVYTKGWVVELMLDLAGYQAERDLGGLVAVEPAAGDGGFLRPMVERLIASCHLHHRRIEDCTEALRAFDLDPVASARARQGVAELLEQSGVASGTARQLAATWIVTGDYLLPSTGLPPADFVIGNPPYIRLEEMEAATAAHYRARFATMVGRADLYVAFFEAALRQLKASGVCAFICADRWMLNQYGGELRRLVTSGFAVETVIELHRADPFEDEVSAYPAITVIRRGRQGAAVVARAEAGVETLGSMAIQAVLRGGTTLPSQPNGHLPLKATTVPSWFEGDAPWPCVSPERLALLKRLEAEFYPLESVGTGTKVGIGVATGADKLFITTDASLVEESRLLPLAMAPDLAGGRLAWSGHYLVNPWSEPGLVDLASFPRLRAYLESHEARLRARHVGKKNAAAWYRTIDRVNLALTAKPKLYIADIKDRLVPVLDSGSTYPHHNLYVVHSYGWHPEVLGGLLLSDIAQFFVECYGVRMRGGYLRFQAQYLRRIRVPRPQDIPPAEADALVAAFRSRNRAEATAVALRLYGIDAIPEGGA